MKRVSRVYTYVYCAALLSTANSAFLSDDAYAAAKAPVGAACNPGASVPLQTPMPVRPVLLSPVGTQVFALPNGSKADLSTDLAALFLSSVAESSSFSPIERGSVAALQNPCQEHLEIRSVVSTFQLDVAEFKFSIGYTPAGGSLGPVTGLNGNANVKVGAISMDFSLWKCSQGSCTAVAAANSNQGVASGGLSFTIDFSSITTGPSLVANSPLGLIFRSMMRDGIGQLSRSPRVNELPWRALVMDSVPSVGSFIFNSGAESRLAVNQAFEVYAPTDASTSGVCNVYKMVAVGHAASVGRVSTSALIDQLFDPAGVRVGDVVMIHHVH